MKTTHMKIGLITLLLFSFTRFSIAQDLYDLDTITQIELSFFDANWNDSMIYYKQNDLENRMLANCVINGVAFDSVGVQYKGNSTFSPNNPKNPLNIKLDYIIEQDYQGFYTLKMANGRNEPSFVREVIGYEVARKYFDAPQCNFAQVYINGNYHGLYGNAESVNKKFIAEKFYSDDENPFFKCDPVQFGIPPGPGCANSFNCSFLYLGSDSSCYDGPYEIKSDYGFEALRLLTLEIQDNPATIENHIDIDRLIWNMAFNNVIVSLDSYLGQPRHNFYAFKDDNMRWDFIPWDLNGCFGVFRNLSSGGGGQASNTQLQHLEPFEKNGDSKYPLLNLIFDNPTYKRMYMAHFRTMFEENIENDWYLSQGGNYQNLIASAYQSDPNAFYSYNSFIANLTTTEVNGNKIGLEELMSARKVFLQNHPEVQKIPPSITNIVAPAVVIPNTAVTITVEITNPVNVFLGYRNSKSEPFIKTFMFDDGLHNDGAMGDGIYGAFISSKPPEIQYFIYAENINAGIFSPQRAEYESYSIAVVGDVVINELSALNDSIATDLDGEFDDWIELYNNSSTAIALDGYYLTDNTSELTKWAFPAGTSIAANDYLIIWADDDITQTGLHASFKINAQGESLSLVDPSLNVVDETIFSTQTADITYGRYPNGTGSFTLMNPTFGVSNSIQLTNEPNVYESNNILLFPNPTSKMISIQFSGSTKSELILIFDLCGKKVKSKNISSGEKLDISTLTNGVYLVQIGNSTSKKLFVQK